MSKAVKYAEKVAVYARQSRLGCLRTSQPHQPQPLVHAEMVRKAPPEELSEREAAPRLAPLHRLALSQVRA